MTTSSTTRSTRASSNRTRNADEPHIGKYRLIKTIGKGNFAKVKLAKHELIGKEVRTNTHRQKRLESDDC
jgi:MAP/microtubule affinity-regulating kinase